jgi:hypothetical protein
VPGGWLPGGSSAGNFQRNSKRQEARMAKLEKRAAKREARAQRRIARRALADVALARGEEHGQDARQ